MAKVQQPLGAWCEFWLTTPLQFAVSEGSTLAGAARTDDPPVVPMSGGQGPAGAAKHHD